MKALSARPPEISVIVPAYNASNHIVEALDSVAGQTIPPHEIVVVDDGSKDDTAEKVTAWAASSFLAVNLIRQDNAGVSAARNRAISSSKGQLLALLDSDDVLLPQHHATLSSPFAGNPRVVVSFADQALFENDCVTTSSFLDRHMPADVASESSAESFSIIKGSAFRSLLNGNYIPTSGSIIAKQFLSKAGTYDLSLPTSEDREFLLRLACLGDFTVTKAVVAKKRVHGGSLTGDASDVALASNAYRALQVLKSKLPQFPTTAEDRAALDAALRHAAQDLFYSASRKGLAEHFRQLALFSNLSGAAIALHPRMMVRAAAASLRWL